MYNEPIVPKGTPFKYKGDLICIALRDCWPGEPMSFEDFEWYVEKPQLDDMIHPAIMTYLHNRLKHVKSLSQKTRYVE